MNCGEVHEDFRARPEYGCGFSKGCLDCGGEVVEDEDECFACKSALFSGETAYEAGGYLFCTGCVSEVSV